MLYMAGMGGATARHTPPSFHAASGTFLPEEHYYMSISLFDSSVCLFYLTSTDTRKTKTEKVLFFLRRMIDTKVGTCTRQRRDINFRLSSDVQAS